MSVAYADFLQRRNAAAPDRGFDADAISERLYPFQRDTVAWAIKKGRAAIFADCGLGKTPMQLEWARLVTEQTGGDVLILAPLAVAAQTVREGAKFGIDAVHARDRSELAAGCRAIGACGWND